MLLVYWISTDVCLCYALYHLLLHSPNNSYDGPSPLPIHTTFYCFSPLPPIYDISRSLTTTTTYDVWQSLTPLPTYAIWWSLTLPPTFDDLSSLPLHTTFYGPSLLSQHMTFNNGISQGPVDHITNVCMIRQLSTWWRIRSSIPKLSDCVFLHHIDGKCQNI